MLRRSTALGLTLLVALTGLSSRLCRAAICPMERAPLSAAADVAQHEPGEHPCEHTPSPAEAPTRASSPLQADCCTPVGTGIVANGGCTAMSIVELRTTGDPRLSGGSSELGVPYAGFAAARNTAPLARNGPRFPEAEPLPPFTLIAQRTSLLR